MLKRDLHDHNVEFEPLPRGRTAWPDLMVDFGFWPHACPVNAFKLKKEELCLEVPVQGAGAVCDWESIVFVECT